MATDDQIWTRRKGESSKAYGLFCKYRDIGPSRTLEMVIENLTEDHQTSPDSLKQFSRKWDWVRRAEDYDDYLDEQQREKNLESIREMNERQAADAVLIQKEGLSALQSVYDDSESKAAIETRKKAAASTWEIGVRNERLARGVATERTEQRGRVKHDFNGDDEELLKDPDYIASKRKAMDEYHAKKEEKQ